MTRLIEYKPLTVLACPWWLNLSVLKVWRSQSRRNALHIWVSCSM